MSRDILQKIIRIIKLLRTHDNDQEAEKLEMIAALEAELAKPEPVQVRPHEFIAMASKQANMIGKPVVWAEYPTPHKIILDEGWEWGHEARAKEALAQPKQEPVAWMLPDYGDVLSASEADGTGIYNIPLYTAPPLKEWVGLTDEQLSETYNDLYTQYTRDDVNIADFILIARTIEEALRKKNERN